MDLLELENGVDPSTHWYYQSKKIPLLKYFHHVHNVLGAKVNIVDFGSGSGFFAHELLKAFPNAIDQILLVDIGYSQEELDATTNDRVRKLHTIPPGTDNVLVVMMDVLEHIQDDAAIMRDVQSRLGRNAYFFITVPAFMSLWSSHDVYLKHFRRYRLDTLRRLLDQTGCRTTSLYYLFGTLFPAVWTIRRARNLIGRSETPQNSDMRPTSPPINWFLKQVNQLEFQFRRWNQWFGVTAAAEGQFHVGGTR